MASCRKDYTCECLVSGEDPVYDFTNVRLVEAEEMRNDMAVAQGIETSACRVTGP